MADHAIARIRMLHAVAPDKPWVTYYAPGTAHAPHHAPKEWIAKFKGQFDMGWDKVREATLARQKALGIVPRILDAINDTGQLDNTLVIYIQGDNGASAEGTPQGLLNEVSIFNNIPEDLTKCWPVWTTRPLYGLKRTSVSGVPMPHNDPIARHVEWSRGYATMKDTYLSGGSCWGAV